MSSFIRIWDDIKNLETSDLVAIFGSSVLGGPIMSGRSRGRLDPGRMALLKDWEKIYYWMQPHVIMYIYTEEFLMEQKSQGKFKPTSRCGL
jgi:hypothetical protein